MKKYKQRQVSSSMQLMTQKRFNKENLKEEQLKDIKREFGERYISCHVETIRAYRLVLEGLISRFAFMNDMYNKIYDYSEVIKEANEFMPVLFERKANRKNPGIITN